MQSIALNLSSEHDWAKPFKQILYETAVSYLQIVNFTCT